MAMAALVTLSYSELRAVSAILGELTAMEGQLTASGSLLTVLGLPAGSVIVNAFARWCVGLLKPPAGDEGNFI